MRRRPLIITSCGLLGIAAVVLVVSLRGDPEHDPEEPGATGRSFSRIELRALTSSPVEALREKTVAGTDRFIVEALDESIEARLGELRKTLLDGGWSTDLEALLSADFVATPLAPRSRRERVKRRGILAEEGSDFGVARIDRSGFIDMVREGIRPLEKLDRVELKVVGIEGETGPVRASVLFFLSGAEPEGTRHQFSGDATLEFRRDDWALRRWTTTRVVHVQLDELPFQDVTERAIGANSSWKEMFSKSIDWFRARLDASSGITVYGHNGLAIGDSDGDGLDDIYVCASGGLPNVLYRARPDGTFDDVSADAGVDILDNTSQALFLDLDNDGDQDLFLVGDRSLSVLLNDGAGRYDPHPNAVPTEVSGRSTPVSIAAADYDLDGVLDIYVASYVFWSGGDHSGGTTMPIPYHEAHNGAPNFLLRGLGDGRFEDVTPTSGLAIGNSRFSFAVGWGDYDDDGDPDIYVANDFGSNNLYRNNGNGTFTEVTAEAGVRDVGAGMSVSWVDYDNDGDLDLHVGNMFSAAGRRVTGALSYKLDDPGLQQIYRRHARGNSLFRNLGTGRFEDTSVDSGAYFGRWAWGSDFVDFDLDGNADLYVQNGFLTAPRKHDL
jgi:hypothetical protein